MDIPAFIIIYTTFMIFIVTGTLIWAGRIRDFLLNKIKNFKEVLSITTYMVGK
jgi:hypothetical protein